MLLCEKQWHALADARCDDDDDDVDADEAAARDLAAEMLTLIEDTTVVQEDDTGKKTYLNRWQLMKSDIALAAYAFDPSHHQAAPWANHDVAPALRRVIIKIRSFNSTTGELDDARLDELRPQFNLQWSQYTNAMGISSHNYVWTETDTVLPSL